MNIIIVFFSLSLVFNIIGSKVFDPNRYNEQTIFGLRSLMFIFPAFVLLTDILSMMRFVINKEKYDQIKKEIDIFDQYKIGCA